MDRVTILKLDDIKKLTNEKQYKKALDVLNTMDISKVKAVKDLSLFAFIYEQNKQYLEAKNILLDIYSKSKTRRSIYYLINIFIKMRYLEEAEKFYDEYLKIAPTDIEHFILRYKLDKAENKSYEDLIKNLEELKSHDYMEEWSYELAKLYHKAGYKEKCIKECNDIILWFGEGINVEKARLLKEYYLGDNEIINVLCGKKKDMEIETDDTLIEDRISQKEEDSLGEINEEKKNEIELDTDKLDLKQVEDLNTKDSNIESKEEEITSIFGNFLKLDDLKNQIYFILKSYSENNKNMIITGINKDTRINFAKRLLTAFFKMGYIKTAKIAKIKSDKLNHLNLDDKYEKLIGGCLIVEQAGTLNHTSIEQLIHLMNREKEIIVILEDERISIDQLLIDSPKLLMLINNRIDIPEYNEQELINLVIDSLIKEEYILDDTAKVRLEEITNKIFETKKPEERQDCLFQVILKGKELAEQRNVLNLGKLVEKGDYEELDLFKIKAEDLVFNE